MSDQGQEPQHKDPVAPEGNGGSELPLWFRISAIGVLVVTLVAHIMVDAFLGSYEGTATSLMLGGIVGTALGLNEFLRGRP